MPFPPEPVMPPVPVAPPDPVAPPVLPVPLLSLLELLHAETAVTSTTAALKPKYFFNDIDGTGTPRGTSEHCSGCRDKSNRVTEETHLSFVVGAFGNLGFARFRRARFFRFSRCLGTTRVRGERVRAGEPLAECARMTPSKLPAILSRVLASFFEERAVRARRFGGHAAVLLRVIPRPERLDELSDV
jgi:hypothetical protein